jgi:hypothetical protein
MRAVFAIAVVVLLAACSREPATAPAQPLLAGLDRAQHTLDRLQLRGAGNHALVTLERRDGAWRVAERDGWPADAGRISQYLFLLSQARRMEGKTSEPRLYPRLGVEPVASSDAAGTELELAGAGWRRRLLIGNAHPRLDGNYVRVGAEAQAWLTDLPVSFDKQPVAWLDRSLVDLPLARVRQVRVAAAGGESFSLSHRDDRFRLDDAPSAAMHDSHLGDSIAGALDQLRFEELASDDPATAIERSLDYASVEGMRVQLQVLRVDDRHWLRVHVGMDEEASQAWAALASANAEERVKLGARVAALERKLAGRRFLIEESLAQTLLLDHAQILAGAPQA